MQQALAAFVGSGAVCYFVLKEPVSSFFNFAGPLGFAIGQAAGSNDVVQTVMSLFLVLEGEIGDTLDVIFSNGLLTGGLFVKLIGGRDFQGMMYMSGGALVAMGILQYISEPKSKKQ